jgi:flavodoxin
MKNLIVYYSFTNNNEKLAEYLTGQLRCERIRLTTVKKRNGFSILLDLVFHRKPKVNTIPVLLKDYDHIIFVAPIWAGRIATPLRSFLTDHCQDIRSYSFITLCGGGNAQQKENIQKELLSIVRKAPEKVLELWVNDLLPADKKNTVRYTSGHRIGSDELTVFESRIRDFIGERVPARTV